MTDITDVIVDIDFDATASAFNERIEKDFIWDSVKVVISCIECLGLFIFACVITYIKLYIPHEIDTVAGLIVLYVIYFVAAIYILYTICFCIIECDFEDIKIELLLLKSYDLVSSKEYIILALDNCTVYGLLNYPFLLKLILSDPDSILSFRLDDTNHVIMTYKDEDEDDEDNIRERSYSTDVGENVKIKGPVSLRVTKSGLKLDYEKERNKYVKPNIVIK